MKRYGLVLDLGKDSTKGMGRNVEETASDIKKVIFKTKEYDLSNGNLNIDGDSSFLLEMNNKQLIIGEQGIERDENFQTTKTTELHKHCAYVAITKFLEPGTTDNKVSIVLACPLSVLTSAEAKEDYKGLIKGDGVIKIKVNNEPYEFEVENIMLKQEDSGIMYLKPELFVNKTVGLGGFGGLNMNFSLYQNGVCVSKFSEELGNIALVNYVKDALQSYLKGNIVTFQQAEKALNDKHLLKQGQVDIESIKVIEQAKEKFFTDAMNIIRRHNYNVDTLDSLVFVGGTSQHIENIIRRKLAHSHVNKTCQWDSIEGLYKIAIKKYGNIEM